MLRGNTVGSREVEKLNSRQRDLLVGKLLGDGCLEKNGKHSRLKIDQTFVQKDYVFWLYKYFSNFSSKPYKLEVYDRRTCKKYYHCRFSTRSIPIFDYWRNLFYKNRRKIIPKSIAKLMSPLVLAIWYMDDGYLRKDCKGIYLCTSGYKLKEQKILQKMLLKKFSLKTKLHFASGNVRIYIPSSEVQSFIKIIKRYILPSFSYKLNTGLKTSLTP